MTDETLHIPTPEFRDRLERTVLDAFRREEQRDARRRRTLRWARMAAVVVVSVAIGATAGLAPAQIRESARRDSLLDAVHADIRLAMIRLQLAQENYQLTKRKFDFGIVPSTTLDAASVEVRTMETQLMRARLDSEEIVLTSAPPRNEINAPLVSNRDFVKERLRMALAAAQQELTAAESALANVNRRISLGATGESSRFEPVQAVAAARTTLGVLAMKLQLRDEFLAKGTPIEELTRRLKEQELRQQIVGLQDVLSIAKLRLAQLKQAQSVGAVEEIEVLRANLEVASRQLELQRLAEELRKVSGRN